MNITKENIEEQILLLADGELDAIQASTLMAYIEKHTEHKAMLDAYLATQLEAEDIHFPDIESLLKKEEPVRLLPFRKRTPALKWAAAVVVLVGLSIAAALLYKPAVPADQPAGLAVIKQGEEIPEEHAAPPTKNTAPAIAAVPDVKAKKEGHTGSEQVLQKANKIAGPAIAAAPEQQREKDIVTPLGTANKTAIALVETPAEAMPVNTKELVAAANNSEEDTHSWSPVNEEKLQGLNDLVAQVKTLKENIQEKTRSLKNTTFVFRWGNKAVALGK